MALLSPSSRASQGQSQALVNHRDGESNFSTLGDARLARKSAELEVKALENRILLLKKEEEKAKQKLSQTKKRAEEIIKLREEALERKKETAKLRSSNQDGFVSNDPEVIKKRFIEKELSKAARRRNLKEAFESKRAGAIEFRSEKKRFEDSALEQKKEMQDEAKRKKEAIKIEREEAARKIKLEKERLREQAREEYNRKIEEEKETAKELERKAKKLQELEVEMMKRLQHTQDIQRKAYDELEGALSTKAKKTPLLM